MSLSISALSILIRVVFSFLSDNFSILAISESTSDAGFVSSNCCLTFSMPCNFFLVARHDVLGNRTAVKKPVNVMCCRGRGSAL